MPMNGNFCQKGLYFVCFRGKISFIMEVLCSDIKVHFLVNSLYGSRIYAIYEKVHREFTQFPGTPLVVS